MKKIFWIPFLIIGCSGENSEPENDQKKNTKDTIQAVKQKNQRDTVKNEEELPKEIDVVDPVCEIKQLDAYIDDPSETATNVRKTPGGEVVLQLPYAQDDYFLTIVDQKDDWFKVSSIEGIEVSYEIPEEGAWVHNSVVGAGTRNYGNQVITIYKYPSADSERTIGEIKIETAVHVLEICNDFVKIKTATDNQVGWVKKEWICGNPLTTCA